MSLFSRRAALVARGLTQSVTRSQGWVANATKSKLVRPWSTAILSSRSTLDHGRCFSAEAKNAMERFVPQPPSKLTEEMASSISEMTEMYIDCGAANQRLKFLASQKDMSVVHKWQSMMEIFFSTQLHIVAGFGYQADEKGLVHFAQDLAAFQQTCKNEDFLLLLKTNRRDTWRSLVSASFELDVKDIPIFSIVDARNHMHKVSARMSSPEVLFEIQQNVSKIQVPNNNDMEMAMKHQALQEIIVYKVYMDGEDGKPGLVEEAGCGSGEKGYAAFQCAMADFEGDPLIGEYTQSAMLKMFDAAGINPGEVMEPGSQPRLTP
eukprot:CAMPEP_0168765314 /NCGR_PEP_ID=MMETSP0725-20121227/258_1 /TAXON_ID=265536 /ORGANISM="Amphiprora sp., Strain CCMP467" /LENGTH=320 /DNA_ID=CAMNT_0008814559 /DNA_START=22 /DNA_END=984 /DNA_ORIENTATION=+